jgi:energy-coupling factor transport system ATP-binding protein
VALPSVERSASTPSTPAAVSVRGWGWRYAGRRAWACRGVDLEVAPGERVLVVGPSGGGKSTLLHGVAGLLDTETAAEREGEVLVDGRPAALARHRTGMLFQDPESSLVMARAGDDVAFGLENSGVPRRLIWPRVGAALETVGFPYGWDRSTAALSGGEQQRLALAGALVRDPALLVLDEPTANLDPAGTRLVLDAVDRTLQATGATLLMVEHHVGAALHLVDRVVVVEPGGGVVDDGPPAEVFGRRGRSLAARGVWVPAPWTPARPARRRTGRVGGVRLTADGLSLHFPGEAAPALAPTDLRLREAEAVAVTGPNGSGKSTLAVLLAGLVRPTAGQARLADSPELPLHRWRARDLCRRVGAVFQDPEHQLLTARVDDELMVGPRRAGVPETAARRRCAELLERLRLGHLAGANPFTLSGGEKRRLSVATALATEPDVLVLDEPTFGQDARTWQELLSLCADLRDAGTSVLAVTHDEAFATALADRRVEVREGVVR